MMDNGEALLDFMQLYEGLPCLWDSNTKINKNKIQKNDAWAILSDKLKEIECIANRVSDKKKDDNLRAVYDRVLNTENSTKKTEIRKQNEIKEKKLKLLDTVQNFFEQYSLESNAFGVYVAEQLATMSKQQKEIAEKIIAEVIFLGKTENLQMDSKVTSAYETQRITSRSASPEHNYCKSCELNPVFLSLKSSSFSLPTESASVELYSDQEDYSSKISSVSEDQKEYHPIQKSLSSSLPFQSAAISLYSNEDQSSEAFQCQNQLTSASDQYQEDTEAYTNQQSCYSSREHLASLSSCIQQLCQLDCHTTL